MLVRVCDECGKKLEGMNGYHSLETGRVFINNKDAGQSSDLCDDHYDPIFKIPKNCKNVVWYYPSVTKPPVTFTVLNIIQEYMIQEYKNGSTLVTPDTTFNELMFDIMDVTEILMRIEDFYKIFIPDGDAEKFQTAQDIIDYLESKLYKDKEE